MTYCDTCGHQYSDICGTCETLNGVPFGYSPGGTLVYKTAKTNADRIRNMTDEELAKFIEQASCPPTTKKIYHECTKDDCVPCWLEWLKQEVQDA